MCQRNNGNVEDLGDRVSVNQEEIVKREEQEKYTEEQANGAEVTRYEMEIGAKFKVKSLNFMKVSKSAKGVQATVSTLSFYM